MSLVFLVSASKDAWAALDGQSDRNLFFPPGLECRQLDYGQGEGQAWIGGVECGFYYGDSGFLSLVIESDDLPLATETIARVCDGLTERLGHVFSWRPQDEPATS